MTPQAPQLLTLAVVSMQAPLHRVNPVGQEQAPLPHSCPVPQGALQAPQWSVSLLRSTQLVPHAVCPATVHVVPQSPAEQSCPAWQAVRQAPQWLPSLCRFTHAPSQSVKPVWQVHWLPTQR
jgi:hypothetical protein